MKSIHIVDVRSAINNYSINPITAYRPHPIYWSEQELPRRTRETLAQYMSRINPEIQDICPKPREAAISDVVMGKFIKKKLTY